MRKVVPLVGAIGIGLFGFINNVQVFLQAQPGRSLPAEEPYMVAEESNTNHTRMTQSSSLAPKHGDLFTPGSLQMSKSETLRRCYVDRKKYDNHMHKRRKCSVSNEYKLAYYMVAKAGSSTARAVMNKAFHAAENNCTLNHTDDDGYYHFTFVRNPVSRFISSYQEMVKRTLSKSYAFRHIPEQYRPFLAPYSNKSAYKRLTEDERTSVFLRFVQDYDAVIPFDGHLRLQTPRLIKDNGRAFELDAVIDTHDMDDHWISMAERVHAPIPQKALHAYSRGTLLNVTRIDRTARRKICQLSALDYCCLNYPLPPECMPQQDDNSGKDEAVVQCRWVMKPDISSQLLIEEMSPYPTTVDYSLRTQ